jgi:hypothetical protein
VIRVVPAALGQSDYTKNASYDLVVPDGGDWGPFTVDDALTTVSGFDSIKPLNMLNDSAQAPNLSPRLRPRPA